MHLLHKLDKQANELLTIYLPNPSQPLSFALGMAGYLAHCLVKEARVYHCVLVLLLSLVVM